MQNFHVIHMSALQLTFSSAIEARYSLLVQDDGARWLPVQLNERSGMLVFEPVTCRSFVLAIHLTRPPAAKVSLLSIDFQGELRSAAESSAKAIKHDQRFSSVAHGTDVHLSSDGRQAIVMNQADKWRLARLHLPLGHELLGDLGKWTDVDICDQIRALWKARGRRFGVASQTFRLGSEALTQNTWRFIVGAMSALYPRSAVPTQDRPWSTCKQWLGRNASFGWIGNGAKCHLEPKDQVFSSEAWRVGDFLTLVMDYDRDELRAQRNGRELGVLFASVESLLAQSEPDQPACDVNLHYPLFAAVSMTGNGSSMELIDPIECKSMSHWHASPSMTLTAEDRSHS